MTRTGSCQTRSRAVVNPPNPAGSPGLRQPIIHHQSSIINPRAFTLVELLVVISVITLLMALLLPALQRSRKQARAVVCRANLRQWGILLKSYTGTSDGGLHNQGFCQIGAPEFWMYWLTRNAPGTEKIRFCPMATKPAYPPGAAPMDRRILGGRYRAWGRFQPNASRSTRLTTFYSGSYAINNWLAVPDATADLVIGVSGANPRRTLDDFWKNENVTSPGDIPLFGDCMWWCTWPKDADLPPEQEEQIEGFPCGCLNSIRYYCINRHDGYINMAFLDGAVRRVGLKQLWTLKWHRNYTTTNRWTKAGGATPESWPDWMRRFKDY
jgi:prepilin-type N-terminal cleavage/methylation domain-containing protein/prepilin-type processing-associated H-X9-DG protein